MQTVLAVDDELSVRQAYRFILGNAYNVLLAEDGPTAFQTLEERHVDLVLLDMVMPGMHGLDVLSEMTRRDASLPVIVVTASNSVDYAVEAMKRGAREYITKPFDVQRLLITIEHTLDVVRTLRELDLLRQARLAELDAIVGQSPALLEALSAARKAMDTDAPALVTGECGTGKNLVARAIHAGSGRSNGPFVCLSCSTTPPSQVPRELFGVDRSPEIGKIRVAEGGTLYVEEIARMELETQERLLDAISSGSYFPVGAGRRVPADARLVASTSRDLDKARAEGLLLPALADRLREIHVEMPPLRRRLEDIPALVGHFLLQHGPRIGARTHRFSDKALKMLQDYTWPGNVRELENVVQRLLMHHGHVEVLEPEHLRLNTGREGAAPAWDELERLPLTDAAFHVEQHLLRRALQRADGSLREAADALRLPLEVLERKLIEHNIDPSAAGRIPPCGECSTTPWPLS